MPIPRVAIVGRPNVGKSSLMNMIAKGKVSIVDPTPGVTRDRVTAIVDLEPPFRPRAGNDPLPRKPVEFVDTGGFGVYVTEGNRFDEIGNDLAKLTQSIEFQIAQAVEGADLILFAVDTQAGITPHDLAIARMLREGTYAQAKGPGRRAQEHRDRPPIRVVATKCDGPRWEAHAAEIAGLGFGEPLMVSASNNYMRREFLDALYDILPAVPFSQRPHADLLLAIIGKRNAGKSTLVNTLANEPRVIVSEIPGTTRDAVDVRFDMDGKSIVAIDTAGLRRKRSFQDAVEHYALDRLERSVQRADVVLLLIDATQPISQVDEQLAMLAQKSYKPAIIVVNKWDLAQGGTDDRGRPATPQRFEEYIREELRGLWYAPISFISGQQGMNVRKTIKLALELHEQAGQRVTTGVLNRLTRQVIDRRGPSDKLGRFAKIYFVAQTNTHPPTITLVVNHPDLFTPNYLRFLSNRFRENFPFPEVPIRIIVRERKQRDLELAGQPARVGEAAATPELDSDLWLSDEFSAPARDEWHEQETAATPSPGSSRQDDDHDSDDDEGTPAHAHEGFDDVDLSDDDSDPDDDDREVATTPSANLADDDADTDTVTDDESDDQNNDEGDDESDDDAAPLTTPRTTKKPAAARRAPSRKPSRKPVGKPSRKPAGKSPTKPTNPAARTTPKKPAKPAPKASSTKSKPTPPKKPAKQPIKKTSKKASKRPSKQAPKQPTKKPRR